MQIHVRTLTGKNIDIKDVEHETTIADIKEKVNEQEGIPPAQQRLIYTGKQMANDKTVADYGLADDVLRIKSGTSIMLQHYYERATDLELVVERPLLER